MLSLSLARDPWERAEPGFPWALLLQTPHILGPRPAGHAVACSPDSRSRPSCESQADTLLPQGSEVLETHKKREV